MSLTDKIREIEGQMRVNWKELEELKKEESKLRHENLISVMDILHETICLKFNVSPPRDDPKSTYNQHLSSISKKIIGEMLWRNKTK